ncbi:MAG: PH domain-containing protein [Candidatus Hinthialibacter antarcticus]|nr:PH domain-containing protein [Candidatus Hinthialibacter antarcticus]
MYDGVKDLILDLLSAPKEAPAAPSGPHTTQRTFRASKQFLHYRWLHLALGAIFLGTLFFIITIVLIINEPLIGVLAGASLAALWAMIFISAFFLIRLEYDMRYYIITDRSLRIRKGVLSILEQTLTFANIQNISIEQGPIERIFGISRLVVETAGGGSGVTQQQVQTANYHQAVMDGLDNAEELRDLVRNYLKHIRTNSGLGDPSAPTKRRSGFSANEIDVLREILTEIQTMKPSSGEAPPQHPGPAGA